jgi:hypothetical protein
MYETFRELVSGPSQKNTQVANYQIPAIRALSAALAAKFNISPGRWQHVLPVAIVPPEI